MGLVDGGVGIGGPAGVGIGDGDAAKAGAADHIGLALGRQVFIEQGVVFGGVAVGPAVDGDGGDVAGGVEAAGGQGPGQLVAGVALEVLEGGGQKLGAAGAVLVVFGQARLAGGADHVDQDRALGRPLGAVVADIHRRVQAQGAVIGAGGGDARHAQFVERRPVAQGDGGVDQGRLDQLVQGRLLHRGQVRADIGDHHVPAGQDTGAGLDAEQLAATGIGDLNAPGRRRIAEIAGAHHDTGQADAHGVPRPVELAVIGLGGDDVPGVSAGQGGGDQVAHQEPGDGGVAVREMEAVGAAVGITGRGVAHARGRAWSERQALEPGQVEGPAVQGRQGVDPHPLLIIGAGLIIGNDAGVGLDHGQKEIAIAYL